MWHEPHSFRTRSSVTGGTQSSASACVEATRNAVNIIAVRMVYCPAMKVM